MISNKNQKSAFIAIVGRPNVGKSSILNRILGQKIAIVSNKPQTTRTRITGVLTQGDTQLVFIDTPGMHRPKNELGKYMVRSVTESVAGVDMCLLVTEAGREITPVEEKLMKRFSEQKIPAVLAINKIDAVKEKDVLPAQILFYSKKFDFDAIVPVSAETGRGLDDLITELKNHARPGGHFFEDDTLTDQPERVIASEMIREKILRLCEKEIPHGTAVVIEKLRQREDSEILDIDATIYCEKESHKRIIIGKSGAMIKKISTFARQDMENFFGCKVNLQTWIKVKEGWRNRSGVLKNFGFDPKDFD